MNDHYRFFGGNGLGSLGTAVANQGKLFYIDDKEAISVPVEGLKLSKPK